MSLGRGKLPSIRRLSMKVISTHLSRTPCAAGRRRWLCGANARDRRKANMKTLIIWENLRNCVFHVTIYYLLLFLLHQTHALIVYLSPRSDFRNSTKPARINRTRYGFFMTTKPLRGARKSTNERNWLLRRGVLCARWEKLESVDN